MNNQIKMDMKKSISIISLIILILVVISASLCYGQNVPTAGPYQIQSGSKIWIEGSTNISKFSCVSKRIDGFGHLRSDSVTTIKTSLSKDDDKPVVFVSLKDHSLDCGKRPMNHDMYHALKADEFPTIHYDLISGRMISYPDSTTKWFKIKTKGRLTIAGKSKIIKMIVDGHQLPHDHFHVKGSKTLRMSDFDIKRPSPFWGLVKTHNVIVVKFDLFVAPSNNAN